MLNSDTPLACYCSALDTLKYWRAPTIRPEPDTRIAAGAVDTGINPLATDSEGQVWENPKAYYVAERKLRRWQRAQARRTPDSRGWWEAQRRIDRLQRRTTGLRRNAQHQMTSTLVNKVPVTGHRRPERKGNDVWYDAEGAG